MKNLLVDPFNLLTGGHASRTIAAHLLTRVGPRWTKELWKSWGGASEQEKKVRDKANIKTWPLRYVCRRYTSSLLENNQLKYIRLMEFERYCNYFPERATTYAKFYTENYEVHRMWWKIIIHQLTKYKYDFFKYKKSKRCNLTGSIFIKRFLESISYLTVSFQMFFLYMLSNMNENVVLVVRFRLLEFGGTWTNVLSFTN